MPTRKETKPRSAADDPLLTEEEARRQLGQVTKRTMKWLRDTHQIEYVRLGRGCRYRQSAIDALVESRTVPTQPW